MQPAMSSLSSFFEILISVSFLRMTHIPNYQRLKSDPAFREIFEKRARAMSAIRQFFTGDGFLEVETPILVNLPGMEPYLDVFKTRFVAEGAIAGGQGRDARDMYLITSPEYAMKKLLVGGMEKIFQLTRSFRNKETGGALHNPEFTILEWYRAHADYTDIMRDTERLMRYVCRELYDGQESFVYQGVKVDLNGDFERLTVATAFEKYAGVSREIFEDSGKLIVEARRRGYAAETYDDAFFLIFLNEIEGKLGGVGADGSVRPTILCEYPVSMAALSRECASDSRYAERFEIYVCGLELCNAFSELTDAGEQEKRLGAEAKERARLGKDLYDVDESFIEALKIGMPPSGGIALGVDRLIMLLLDQVSIEDVMLFPFRDL